LENKGNPTEQPPLGNMTKNQKGR